MTMGKMLSPCCSEKKEIFRGSGKITPFTCHLQAITNFGTRSCHHYRLCAARSPLIRRRRITMSGAVQRFSATTLSPGNISCIAPPIIKNSRLPERFLFRSRRGTGPACRSGGCIDTPTEKNGRPERDKRGSGQALRPDC